MGQAMKLGRPRKINVVRDTSGKSRGEILDFKVVMNQPHRRGTKDPLSHLLGYPLGQMNLRGHLSDSQLRTGNAWASLVKAYSGMLGVPSCSPKSGEMAERVSNGFYVFEAGTELDPDEGDRRRTALRERYNECFKGLLELGMVLGRRHAILVSLRKVCVEERYPHDSEIGDIRLGLNALERILQVGK